MIRLLAIVLAASAPGLLAGPDAIGVASSKGKLEVDGVRLEGHGNVNSGSVVRTADLAGRVDLNQVAVTLGPRTQVKLYAGRMVLTEGVSLVSARRDYTVEALGLQVAPSAGSAVARIEYLNAGRVAVGAVNGELAVRGAGGILVARVKSGSAVAFDQAPAGSHTTTVTGEIRRENGKYLLSDRATGLTVELTGRGLDSHTGKRVRVSGTGRPNADDTSQVVEVASVTAAPSKGNSDEPVPGGGASGGMPLVFMANPLLWTTVIVGAGVGLGYGIYEATNSN
ncbi:MAG: hypothetical protein FJW40_02880 [Acidobacteria bacterium]|nr:hypothetical protein [Acidobacteriota bacterium]